MPNIYFISFYSCRTLLFPYYYAENLTSFTCETVGFGPAVDIAGCSSAKLPASPSPTSSNIALELELAFELALELELVRFRVGGVFLQNCQPLLLQLDLVLHFKIG